MEPWIGWRLVKLVGLVLLSGGVVSAALGGTRGQRVHAAYAWAIPGFVATWAAGWRMMGITERGVTAPFIAAGIALSLASLHAVILLAHKEAPHLATRALALGGLVATVVVMVVRPDGAGALAAWSALGFALGAAAVMAAGPASTGADPADLDAIRRGFGWVARAEGLSLVLMMVVSMPMRRLTGEGLDGGTGLLGWVHGALVLVYVQALSTTARSLGWSWRRWAAGFGLALVPFGAFVFERQIQRDADTAPAG